jgi:hypothetical protein
MVGPFLFGEIQTPQSAFWAPFFKIGKRNATCSKKGPFAQMSFHSGFQRFRFAF